VTVNAAARVGELERRADRIIEELVDVIRDLRADLAIVDLSPQHWPRHGDLRFGVRQECDRWRS
jgi:hypothetical protein